MTDLPHPLLPSSESEQRSSAPAITPPVPTPEKLAPARNSEPKWEVETRDRVKASIRKFSKPLQDLVDRDANEGDTRLLVTDFLTLAFGYDKYADLTTEYMVKGEYADYGIRIDKELVAFVEVKRVATKLAEKHLRQVQMYAANEGVEWMILTNGVIWQAYHLTAGLPLVTDLALEVDLLDGGSANEKAKSLFYLTHESFKRHQIDDLWQQKRVTSPASLAKTLLSPKMVTELRKELRRTSKFNADEHEIRATLLAEVIRPELLKP